KVASGTIKAYCSCPAFATYDSCKHIVAVLLGIGDRSAPASTPNYELTNRFIDAITDSQQKDADFLPEKVPMRVEYYCSWSYERTLYIELKTGENRCFVVRNALDFLESVLSGQ